MAGDAAQHRVGADAIDQRQIAALAAAGVTDLQAPPGLQVQARPVESRLAIDQQRHIGAGERQPKRFLRLEFHTALGDFQHGALARITQQAVGPGRRRQVHGARRRHAEVLPAVTAGILQQAQGAGLDHPQAAHPSPPSAR
ncbi:hypothetical protein D9M70_555170 [compost metagenome]